MRQLAVAGAILLACLLALATNAQAHNRYTGGHAAYRQSYVTESVRVIHRHRPIVTRSFARLVRRTTHGTVRARMTALRWHRPMSIRPARAGIANIVLSAARRYGVPASLAYGVARVESNFNPSARSSSGAVGLMQILPSTARGLGCRGSLTNARSNAECGIRYLAEILHDHRGNLRMAAAMYNQGRYARALSRSGARYASLVLHHGKRRWS